MCVCVLENLISQLVTPSAHEEEVSPVQHDVSLGSVKQQLKG